MTGTDRHANIAEGGEEGEREESERERERRVREMNSFLLQVT